MKEKSFIWVTFERYGFHSYLDAPEEVKFLKNVHRHMFKFKVYIEVFHNNRDVEFFMFKDFLVSLFEYGRVVIDGSCEMISDQLFSYIKKKYPLREVWIEVSEDGENGILKKYEVVEQ